MKLVKRIKRVAEEFLGLEHWPRNPSVTPANFEEQIYEAIIRPGDYCYDVGANVGDVSLFLARLAGPSGKVIAFEPVLAIYETLRVAVERDSHLKAPIVTHPYGLAESEKQADINVPKGLFGMGSMAPRENWSRVQETHQIDSYDCRFIPLDSLISQKKQVPPDFIKIDVEGAELYVLRGATELLKRYRPLMLIEVFSPWERAFGYGPWEVFTFLMGYGYEFLFACPEGLVAYTPSQTSPFPSQYIRGYNVVAFNANRHRDRVPSLYPLLIGAGTRILAMPPPPCPNSLA
jgi:FkbM family methyltransferase